MDLVHLIMPYERTEEITPPFALLYLGTVLKKAGYEVKLSHCTPDEFDSVIKDVLESDPLFVGFSVITGLPTVYAYNMSEQIKKTKNIPIVWGGVHASMVPEDCLRNECIDLVVIGEGEETVVELADFIKQGRDVSRIKGLAYKRDGGDVVCSERDFIRKLSDYRIDFSLLDLLPYVNISKSKRNGSQIRSMGYISSRGCPHKCGFCYNLKYNKRKCRYFSKEIVFEDIAYLKDKYGINAVHFWDDNFFANKPRALEILDKINMYVSLELRIDYVDEELAKQLQHHKVTSMLIGIESGSDRMLDLMNKGITVKQIVDNAKLFEKYKVPAQYSFILGLPTESRQERDETIRLMYKLYKLHSRASFTVGMYLPYPGTDLYQLAIQNGFKQPSSLIQWGQIDRWRNTVPLPWISQKYCLNVRHVFALLRSPGGKWLQKYLDFKIRRNLFDFGFDLRLIILSRTLYQRLTQNIRSAIFRIKKKYVGNEHIGGFLRKRYLIKYNRIFNVSAQNILDAGCGAGDISLWLAGRYPNSKIKCVDTNKDALDGLKRRAKEQKVNNIDANLADLRNFEGVEEFDMAVCIDVVIYFGEEENRTIFSNIYQALRKGGILYLHLPRNNWDEITILPPGLYKEMKEKHNKEKPGYLYEPDKLIDVLKRLGYNILFTGNTFGFFGKFVWEIDQILQERMKFRLRLALLPFLKIIAILDTVFAGNKGCGIMVVAKK